MSAYKDALHLDPDDRGVRLDLARSILKGSSGVVVLGGVVALRPQASCVICEVIVTSSNQGTLGNCIEAAREMLMESPLWHDLRIHDLKWIAVEDYGTGIGRVSRA